MGRVRLHGYCERFCCGLCSSSTTVFSLPLLSCGLPVSPSYSSHHTAHVWKRKSSILERESAGLGPHVCIP